MPNQTKEAKPILDFSEKASEQRLQGRLLKLLRSLQDEGGPDVGYYPIEKLYGIFMKGFEGPASFS